MIALVVALSTFPHGSRRRAGPWRALTVGLLLGRAVAVNQVPLLRRGARACSRYAEEAALPSGYRLISHAVSDATAAIYLPHVESFFEWASTSGLALGSAERIDLALAKRLDALCYGERRGLHYGQALVSGLHCFLPELKGELKRGSRALIAWSRMNVVAEGAPICEETVHATAAAMMRQGWVEDAVRVEAHFDGYLRLQDTRQLRREDMVASGRICAATFGVSRRGESVKTGQNQGVVFNRGAVSAMLWGIRNFRRPGDLMFQTPDDLLRRRWTRAQLSLQCPPSVVHDLRHAGPSEDMLRERRGLGEIRRRGRWRSKKSVMRYTKTHWLVRIRAQTPPGVLRSGEQIRRDLYGGLAQALREGPGCATPLGLAVLEELEARRFPDNRVEFRGLQRKAERRADLAFRSKKELQTLAKEKGVSSGGPRSLLIGRLEKVESDSDGEGWSADSIFSGSEDEDDG